MRTLLKGDYQNYFDWMQLHRIDFIEYIKIAEAYATLVGKTYSSSSPFAEIGNLFHLLMHMARDTEYGQHGQIHYDQFVELIPRVHIAWARYQFEQVDINHD